MVNSLVKQQKIEITNVSHSYSLDDHDLPVLEDIDLTIEPNEFVVILGPSGCGKSTLLRMVAGLEHPEQGSIKANGEEIISADPSRIVVFQDPTLFPWLTVRQNVELGFKIQKKKDDKVISDMLEMIGLAGFDNAYPSQLSGGMAQRVALARALVNDPSVLILDEPLGKLDSLTRITMQKELVNLWQNKQFTGLMVTHDIEEALLLATRIIVMRQRPAHIIGEFKLDMDYPRHRDAKELLKIRREIFGLLGHTSDW
ncbi:ABC transporter ATP-binding protein [Commensalibacter nepenthis]|uniref:ABC transporter ATP-binding protein n=1 Tax=Commensalibacter nepenthis TaxID=3043872 RepID=A0ABT6Q6X2_9PROT|nr:ABC transporter ATP-binding protein [Commensalibacter sp. TBRC 10068]MDI2111993.1 ABC transporter ATP-binding protein [Commensalibacter sp. TBRC 10068]